MYRVKEFTQNTIKENSQLKDEIEEEYYKLLIKIAENKCSDQDLKKYYFTIEKLKK
jgi:hypothetical protein